MPITLTPILAVGLIPSALALFLTICFVAFLFRREVREKPNVTGALWLPTLWLLIIGSRAVSEWLDLFGLHWGAGSLEAGSPLDASVYYILIVAGIYVLNKRRVQLSAIIRNNQWITIFLVYCFLAVFWSDFSFVAFKRWTKVIGHPIMVLIIFSEPDPLEALTRLMKRCAYIIVPVSILFIKYYPQWGRGFSEWTGQACNTGITLGKNALGYDCLILGFFFFWYLLQIWRTERGKARRNELLLTVGFLVAIWWLLLGAQSSTSFMSLSLGMLTVVLVGLRFVDKRIIGTYIVITVLAIAAANSAFGIYDYMLVFLHRDPTLTDRTLLWHDLLKMEINPVLGVGFESFWLGDRLKHLWVASRWAGINEAHNGYLETYLNLGLVGLLLLIGLLIATFRKVRLELLRNFEFGRFRLGFFVAVMVYNWTEASFKALHPVWFVFYIIALDYPKLPFISARSSFEAAGLEENEELAYANGKLELPWTNSSGPKGPENFARFEA
jgi:exopolysaccharide production protein ExoQ